MLTKKLIIILLITFSVNVSALSLKESIQKTIENNPEIAAEIQNQKAFSKYVDEKEGAYLPTVDLNLFLEKNKTKQNFSTSATDNDISKKGWNGNLSIEQILYNGNLTSGSVNESKANEIKNKHRSNLNIQTVVINSLNSYININQYKELMSLSQEMIKINDDNLVLAKDKEEISGEVLETHQVSAKLHFAQDKYQEQQEQLKKNQNNFKNYTGIKAPDSTCRPIIDSSNIPSTLAKTLELAVINSDKVLEALAEIKIQEAKLTQSNSKFLPTLKLRLESSMDKDLELNGNGKENEQLIRLNLNWNIYNGGSDYYVSQREQEFLIEAKKNLDAVTATVVADVKTAYFKYISDVKRVNTLKQLKHDNQNIVSIYKEEFEGGTRTFIDILNAESELYQVSTSLVNREYIVLSDYYELLFNLSTLSKTVLADKNQTCQQVMPMMQKEIKKEKNEDLNLSKNDSSTMEKVMAETSMTDGSLLLSAPTSYYTINLATFNSLKAAKNYIQIENIQNDAFAFLINNDNNKAKIIYGAYSTYKEAKMSMENLSASLVKNQPYVDNLKKHQKLYKKYN